MDNLIKNYKTIHLNRFSSSLFISITAMALLLIYFEFKKNEKTVKDIATAQALSHFNKDQAFRHWAALHGGVYIKPDSLTPPNPYLSHIKHRDVITTDGIKLTLMNPAYMVRQLNEYFAELYGIGGHITSLIPLRPENKPDEWEENALSQFENGIQEVSEFVEINGKPYFRLMRPMITQESCLKCHGHQGYASGDIRGGVSVMIPEEAIIIKSKADLISNIMPIVILWVLGSSLVIITHKRLNIKIQERDNAELALVQKHMELQATEEELRASNEELRVNSEELQETNQYLEKAKARAEENDKLKSAFLANMSHEIRTPMNAILGFSNFLNEKDIDENERKKYIRFIQSGSTQLLQLINDIIDISRIETGQLAITKSNFDLNQVLEEMVSMSKMLLKSNDKDYIKIILNQKSDKKIIINSDITRFKQILLNLISNAIKFTNKGFIELGYKIEDEKIQFFVKDSGIGVSKDKHGVIFNRFVQLEDYMTREYGGTGIGLAIVKGLVELLEGNIWLSSEIGKGCCFYFDIPHQTRIQKTIDIKSDPEYLNINFNGKTVLIVEDDESNYIYLKKLLENKNVKILHAINGEIAIELCKLHKGIDLVLMDIQLPVLNGIEATKIIRTFNSDIPIIAQTAYAMLEDEQKCLEVGCNDYITKPIEHGDLLSKMNNLLN